MKHSRNLSNKCVNVSVYVEGMGDKAEDSIETFEQLHLDPKLLAALQKANFVKLTQPQKHAIPAALEGKDVWLKSSTGSGKTLAYAIPAIQRILTSRNPPSSAPAAAGNAGGASKTATPTDVHALVLVPTKELCWQVERVFRTLTRYCSSAQDAESPVFSSVAKTIEVVGLVPTGKTAKQQQEALAQKFTKKNTYYVVVGTPTQVNIRE